MIRDDAQRISTLLTERMASGGSGVVAEVEAISNRAEFNAPGGARPTFVRYKVRIRDQSRVAHLDLDEAEALVDALEAGCGSDRVFEEIASRGLPVEPGEPHAV